VTFLSESQWGLLVAIGVRVVPETAALTAAQRDEWRAIIAGALGDRPEAMRRQFRAFLGIIERGPVVRFGAPFSALGPERQDRVLRWFQDCPVALLRKGFWGMKALVLMGYYARPEAAAEVGWTPSFRGNEKLHA
jgi:hypothetical protein